MNKERGSLKKKADKLFSLLVRQKGYCELAGKDKVRCGGHLQCAHIFTRSYHSIRWSENNAVCLCAGHHVYYTHHPSEWEEIIRAVFPVKWAASLEGKRDKWDKDINKVLEQLEEEYGRVKLG